MKPYDFNYTKASSVEEALKLLKQYEGGAKIIAGGQSLVASLNMRLSSPELLVDINEIEELQGISELEECVRVGALVRHVEIYRSAQIVHHLPLLNKAIHHVAHAAIRNRGTHGGSIAYADPSAEIPACTVALNASLVLRSLAGERRVLARNFFQDLYETQLQEDEILVAVEYPITKAESVSAFFEITRRKVDFATAGLALSGERNGELLDKLAIVFFGVANTPLMAPEIAATLTNRNISAADIDSAVQKLSEELNVIGDLYASAEMKLHLAKHLLTQALADITGKL